MEEENEPNTAGKQENNDNTSEEVKNEVKLLKVDNTTLDPDEKEAPSPYEDFVNVSTSFDYTVEQNKIDETQNIFNILASIIKRTLTN